MGAHRLDRKTSEIKLHIYSILVEWEQSVESGDMGRGMSYAGAGHGEVCRVTAFFRVWRFVPENWASDRPTLMRWWSILEHLGENLSHAVDHESKRRIACNNIIVQYARMLPFVSKREEK